MQALLVICLSLPFNLIYAWYVRQYPPDIGYECITRTLPFARRFLLYQLTILPFGTSFSIKNTADSCSFFSVWLSLNLINCVFLNRYAGILYLRSSPSNLGAGISPIVPWCSVGIFPACAGPNRILLNTMITLNNLISTIHFMTGNLSLRY